MTIDGNRDFWKSYVEPFLPDEVKSSYVIDQKTLGYLKTYGPEAIQFITAEDKWNADTWALKHDGSLSASISFGDLGFVSSMSTSLDFSFNEVEGGTLNTQTSLGGQIDNLNGVQFSENSNGDKVTSVSVNLFDTDGKKVTSNSGDLVFKKLSNGSFQAEFVVTNKVSVDGEILDGMVDYSASSEIVIFQTDWEFSENADGTFYLSEQSTSLPLGLRFAHFRASAGVKANEEQYRLSFDEIAAADHFSTGLYGGFTLPVETQLVGLNNGLYNYLETELPGISADYGRYVFLASSRFNHGYSGDDAHWKAAALALNHKIGDLNNYLNPETVTSRADLEGFIDQVKANLIANGEDFTTFSGNKLGSDILEVPSTYVSQGELSLTVSQILGGVNDLGDLTQEQWQLIIDEVKSQSNDLDGFIIEATGVYPLLTVLEDGTEVIKYINIAGAKVQAFETEFADAQVNGAVIASSTQSVTRADGSIVDVTNTEFEDGAYSYSVEEVSLTNDSPPPADGVLKTVNVIQRDLSGNYIGQHRTSEFNKEGFTYQSHEYQTEPDGNVHIRQDIIRPDGNGGLVEYEGALYVVPSADLLSSFNNAGITVGGLLANHLADDGIANQILYNAALKTIGEHFGTFGAFLATGSDPAAAIKTLIDADYVNPAGENTQITPEIQDTFVKHLSSATISAVSNVIVDEVGDILGIDGTIGGDIFNVVGGTITTGILSEQFGMLFQGLDAGLYTGLLSGGSNFNSLYHPEGLHGPTNITVGDYVQFQVLSALGSFAGARLAGEIVEAESEAAALFGAAGAAFASAIGSAAGASVAAGASLSVALSTAFSSSATAVGASVGSVVPIIGTAIGAFVGTIVGTVFGNLFGGSDEPSAWADIRYNAAEGEFEIFKFGDKDGGQLEVATGMAKQMLDAVNNVIDLSHGTLRLGASSPSIRIGYKGDRFRVGQIEESKENFDTPADAVMHGAFELMRSFDLVGGHAILMRAWHNSDAENIHEFKEDLEIAEAFQNYLLDPTSILALMLNEPDSDLAQAWAAILQRAAELELHLPSDKDLDGGWGSILLAQGVDPSLVPDIEGDTIVLTDPNTGEETILHHAIGPGYEIVRIEGTDGNDIIEVIVDGPSVTYIDAGDGNDIVEGSDQADIIVGGAGDDELNGNDGNDWLHGGSGEDTIDGGAGEDTIIGADDADYLVGGHGADFIYGNEGDDELYALSGNDNLYGGDGNDFLYGSNNGSDVVRLYGGDGDNEIRLRNYDRGYGGQGDDDFYVSGYSSKVIINRDEGHDIVHHTTPISSLVFDKTIGINELHFEQSNSNLIISVLGEDQSVTILDYYQNSRNLSIQVQGQTWHGYERTTSGGTTLIPNNTPSGQYNYLSDTQAAENTVRDLNLGSSQQAIHDRHAIIKDVSYRWNFENSRVYIGGDESEQLGYVRRSDYKDYISLGAGDDSIDLRPNSFPYQPTPNVNVYGDSGDDHIIGTDGNNVIVGGLGNDELVGWSGNDRVYGGHGHDLIYGNDDNDKLFGGAGNDYIYGGAGDDILEGGDGDDYLSDDLGHNELSGGLGNDTLISNATAGSNFMSGGDGDDIFTGSYAADTISGDAGHDTITTRAGDDWIYGGAGNDVISGGDGDDIINGGFGDDTYIYNLGDDSDLIVDAGGVDTLQLGAGIDFSNTVFSRSGYDMRFDFDSGATDQIIIKNFYDQSIGDLLGSDIYGIDQVLFADGQILNLDYLLDEAPYSTEDTITFDTNLFSAYSASTSDTLTQNVSNDGDILTLNGDTFQKMAHKHIITEHTILEFDVRASDGVSAFSIGVDKDTHFGNNDVNFRLDGAGNFPWNSDYNNQYLSSNEWQHYSIRVGDYFGGDINYLTFNHNDAIDGNGAQTSFANVRFYEEEISQTIIMDDTNFSSYGYNQDQTNDQVLSDDGLEVTLTGNTWRKFAVSTEVTPDTVLEFEFKSTVDGDSQGIGIDTNNLFAFQEKYFQLNGTDAPAKGWYPQYDNYQGAGEWQQYSIRLGDFYDGDVNYLTFINEQDGVSAPDAESAYRNIRFYDDPAEGSIRFNEDILSSYGYNQDTTKDQTISNYDRTVELTGDTWRKMAHFYTITEDTVLEFDFKSTVEGQRQGIGIDTENNFAFGETFFELHGTSQTSWLHHPASYEENGDWQHFQIRVGDYYTGGINYLTFINGNDADPLASDSSYSNVRLYELSDNETVVLQPELFDDYGYGEDDANTQVLSDDGNQITIEGDAWRSMEYDYTVTAQTILEFDFRVTDAAAWHGIGLDTSRTSFQYNANELFFELYGPNSTSGLWNKDYEHYDSSGEWQHFSINLGDYHQGAFDYLTFISQHGDNTDPDAGESSFSNIRIYESSQSDDVYNGDLVDNIITAGDGDDILIGASGSDTLDGALGDDILYGQDGLDTLIGGLGADTFVFEASSAFDDVDTISDFNTSEGDVLDLAALLGGYDATQDAITDFIEITEVGTDSVVSVDADGGADAFVQIATLTGVTGLTDENTLEASGNLITV